MRYLLQAFLALAVLIGLPSVIETPTSTTGMIAAAIGALILIGVAFRGIVGFVNSRRPKRFPDSMIAPKDLPKKEDL